MHTLVLIGVRVCVSIFVNRVPCFAPYIRLYQPNIIGVQQGLHTTNQVGVECEMIQGRDIGREFQATVFAAKITRVFEGMGVGGGVGGGVIVGGEERVGDAVTGGFPLVDEGGGKHCWVENLKLYTYRSEGACLLRLYDLI